MGAHGAGKAQPLRTAGRQSRFPPHEPTACGCRPARRRESERTRFSLEKPQTGRRGLRYSLREYEFHPESNCADAGGNPCGKQAIGLLQRRHIRIEQIKYIGKESNSLEDVESGLIHLAQSVYTE